MDCWRKSNWLPYILHSQRWRSSIQSAKTRPGADCASDHQLLIANFKLKLKRVGKPTGLVRYNQNQIPYEYTVEVKNRFKEVDLVDRVPEELGIESCNTVQEAATKTIPKKRNCKKAKWLSNEALQMAEKRRVTRCKGVPDHLISWETYIYSTWDRNCLLYTSPSPRD